MNVMGKFTIHTEVVEHVLQGKELVTPGASAQIVLLDSIKVQIHTLLRVALLVLLASTVAQQVLHPAQLALVADLIVDLAPIPVLDVITENMLAPIINPVSTVQVGSMILI